MNVAPDEFLDGIFGDYRNRHDRQLWVTGFSLSPDLATGTNWRGCGLNVTGSLPPAENNAYYSIGVFKAGGTRSKADQIEVAALVLDDISKDAMPGVLAICEPTYILETSPDNHQVGFAITDTHNLVEYERLLKKLIAAGRMKADRSGNSTARYVRLPGYLNTKEEVIAIHGEPFRAQTTLWAPERRYSVAELADRFGIDLHDEVQRGSVSSPPDEGPERESDAELIHQMVTGKSYHDPILRLTARYRYRGIDDTTIVEIVQGLMLASSDRSDRWQARFRDISRMVAGASKYAPTSTADSQPFAPKRLNPRELAGTAASGVDFKIYKWIPERAVTLLGAHGGIGKSLAALQLGVALALGLPFFGLETKKSKVILLSAEDGENVIHQRLAHICAALGIQMEDLDGQLLLLDATQTNPVLFAETGYRKTGKTSGCDELKKMIKNFGADMVIIDNASDVYDADEIKRAHVRAFIRQLAALVHDTNGAVLLLAHVDKQTAKVGGGGQGYSGSTAWNNSVRSRWYMSEKEGVVTLAHEKANHSTKAEPIGLVFDEQMRVFVRAGTASPNPMQWLQRDAHMKAILALLQDFEARGETISTGKQAGNNPFKSWQKEKGFPTGLKRDDLDALMRDMERKGQIARIKFKDDQRKHKERWGVAPKTDFAPGAAGL